MQEAGLQGDSRTETGVLMSYATEHVTCYYMGTDTQLEFGNPYTGKHMAIFSDGKSLVETEITGDVPEIAVTAAIAKLPVLVREGILNQSVTVKVSSERYKLGPGTFWEQTYTV